MALEYRHEFKYVVSVSQIAYLRSRIRPLMELDSHTGSGKNYQIRSLYFDDYRNSCFYENEEGTSPREKFRIRIYNASPDVIRLELKRKERGKTHKESCPLSRKQCGAMLEGRLTLQDIKGQDAACGQGRADGESGPPCGAYDRDRTAVLRKFYLKQETRRLAPRVIVEYEREAYVYRNGNVRVTFDTDIRSAAAGEHFFDPMLPARPVMPTGFHLLEVKYDGFLPDHIYRALQTGNLTLSTFSKYYLCRKYNMGGINSYGI